MMTKKDLEALLGGVAAQNIKTTDAANLIGGALAATRAPWLAVATIGLALASVLALGVRGCHAERLAAAARACPACPAPSCEAAWTQARTHHAKEMLRGLRLRCSYGLEAEQ